MAAVFARGLIAHGGVGGAVVETLLVLGIAAVFVALWWRERRRRRREDDQIRPQ